MDITGILKTVAPWIGTALGGPLGGMAVEAASNIFGLTDKTTEDLKAAISGATPEQMLALKKADQDFGVQMQALGFKQITDLETIAAGDRDSARKMQEAAPSRMPAIMSLLISSGFFGILISVLVWPDKAQDNAVVQVLLGALGVAFTGVVNFWFGSTANSFAKTQLLAKSNPPA